MADYPTARPYDSSAEDQARSQSIAQAAAAGQSRGARPLDVSTRPYNPITTANDPDLASGLAASSATQRDSFARNPVTSGSGQPGIVSQVASSMNEPLDTGPYNRPYGPIVDAVKNIRTSIPNFIHSLGNSTDAAPLAVNQSTGEPRKLYSDRASGPQVGDPAVSVPVPSPSAGIVQGAAGSTGMTTEQANQVYGDQNRIANAANQMAANYSAQVGAENARRPSPYEARIAQREADMKSFDATQGADAVLGSPGLYKDQRNALRARAEQGQTQAAAVTAASRAPSTVTPPNLVQSAVAETDAAQKARAGAYDLEKGGLAVAGGKQGLQKGALDIKSQQAHLAAVNALTNAKPGSPEALQAERTLVALAGKTEPGWKAQVVGGGLDENGIARPGSVLFYNQSTGEHSMHSGNGQELNGQPQSKYTKDEERMDPNTKKIYKFDGKNWNPK